MVVVLVIEMVLVAATAVTKPLLTRQPALIKELECAINRREPNSRVFLPDQQKEILGAKVALRLEKRDQYHLTLRGLLEACSSNMLEKYLFLL